VLRVRPNLFDLGVSYVAGERILYVLDTFIDVVGCSLGEHFDRAVAQVTHEAGQPVAIGHAVSGESEPHALHVTHEDYLFGNLHHF
jgi:hypothetical protein